MKLEALPKETILTTVKSQFKNNDMRFNIAIFVGEALIILGVAYCILMVYYKAKVTAVNNFLLSKVFNTPIRMFLTSALALSFFATGFFNYASNPRSTTGT